MHIPSADRPNEFPVAYNADSEYDEHRAPGPVGSDCDRSLFVARVAIVRVEKRITIEDLLDLVDRNAVLLALA